MRTMLPPPCLADQRNIRNEDIDISAGCTLRWPDVRHGNVGLRGSIITRLKVELRCACLLLD